MPRFSRVEARYNIIEAMEEDGVPPRQDLKGQGTGTA